MTLGEHDHIVGAWAEAPSGPGWSNHLIWVCVRNGLDGSHRVDAIQPEEMTAQLAALFPVCRAASDNLIAWVRVQATTPRRRSSAAKGRRART